MALDATTQAILFAGGRFEIRDINMNGGILLNIYDISDRQLEGIRYLVVDDEWAMIGLQCAEFDCVLET
jgi:hypothetical protein